MLILNMDEEVDVYYLWQRGGGRGGGTWGDNAAWEENAGAGENAKHPQSLASSIQPILQKYSLQYPVLITRNSTSKHWISATWRLYTMEMQCNQDTVQLRCSATKMQCNQVNIKCITKTSPSFQASSSTIEFKAKLQKNTFLLILHKVQANRICTMESITEKVKKFVNIKQSVW